MNLRGKEAINVLTGVAPAVFSPEVRGQMTLPSRVVINDLTLREGRQVEGTILTPEECVRIAECLVNDLNVPMIQMGGYRARDRVTMKAVMNFIERSGKKVRTEAMTSAHQNFPRFNREQLMETIDFAADSGFGVVICLAASRSRPVRRPGRGSIGGPGPWCLLEVRGPGVQALHGGVVPAGEVVAPGEPVGGAPLRQDPRADPVERGVRRQAGQELRVLRCDLGGVPGVPREH